LETFRSGFYFIWASIAQGSGELIWWPYFATKYSVALIGLILPASIFQFFINQEVSRYTALTGEGIWQGFKRVNKFYTIFCFCWLLFVFCGLGVILRPEELPFTV